MKQLIAIISIFLLFIYGCKREQNNCIDTPQISYNYISKASLELTQYFTNPKFDTISFTSNKDDTLVFVKTKTDSTWYDDKKYTGVPGCGPNEIQKNLEITNFYSTIKGLGDFKVKHSKKTITKYDNTEKHGVIEIYFEKNHFYYYEHNFFDSFHSKYIGNYTLVDTVFKNVLFGFPDFNNGVIGVKGYFAPNLGLIEVKDTINSISYKLNR